MPAVVDAHERLHPGDLRVQRMAGDIARSLESSRPSASTITTITWLRSTLADHRRRSPVGVVEGGGLALLRVRRVAPQDDEVGVVDACEDLRRAVVEPSSITTIAATGASSSDQPLDAVGDRDLLVEGGN